jgi:hypothetical protein
MKLRVETPAGVLAKQPHHQPSGVNVHDLAMTTNPGVSMILYPTHHRIHRPVMGLDHLLPHLVVAYCK